MKGFGLTGAQGDASVNHCYRTLHFPWPPGCRKPYLARRWHDIADGLIQPRPAKKPFQFCRKAIRCSGAYSLYMLPHSIAAAVHTPEVVRNIDKVGWGVDSGEGRSSSRPTSAAATAKARSRLSLCQYRCSPAWFQLCKDSKRAAAKELLAHSMKDTMPSDENMTNAMESVGRVTKRVGDNAWSRGQRGPRSGHLDGGNSSRRREETRKGSRAGEDISYRRYRVLRGRRSVIKSPTPPGPCLLRECTTHATIRVATANLTQLAARGLLQRLRMAGNSYEIVILSSSPPAAELYAPSSPPNGYPATRRVAMSPSSHLAFSPPVSPRRRIAGASKTNLRAAPIPDGAVRGFATVNSLIRSEHFANQLYDNLTEGQHAQSRRGSLEAAEGDVPASKKPRGRPTKKSTAGDSDKTKPKPRRRKATADKANTACDPELRLPASTKSPFFAEQDTEPQIEPQNETAEITPGLTKSGKPRKPRAKKQKAESAETAQEPKLKKPRVTKVKAAAKDGKLQRDDASLVSAHFRDNANRGEDQAANELGTLKSVEAQNMDVESTSTWEVPPSPQPKNKAPSKKRPSNPMEEALHLEEAVARRRDWTPPPQDTAVITPFTDSVGKENKHSAQDTNGTFTHMLSNFAYAQSPSAPTMVEAAGSITKSMGLTKRRRVELVEVPSNQTNSRNSSPEKGKAPKKKVRTITDLVTGQYGPKDPNFDPQAMTSDFFQLRTTATKVPLNDTSALDADAPPKKAPHKRSKSKSDTENTKTNARARKTTAKVPKPKAVAEKLLSPTSAVQRLGRQDVLFGTSSQLALEESPTMVRQLQLALKESEHDAEAPPSFLLPAPPRWPRLGKVIGTRGLWAASTRDDEGGMLEHVGDVYIPEPDRTQDIPLLMDSTRDESDAATFLDIDDLNSAPAILISSDLPTPPHATSRGSQTVESGVADHSIKDVVFEDIQGFEQEPPPSNQNVDSEISFADIDDFDFPPSAQLRMSPSPKLRPPASATADESSKRRHGRTPKAAMLKGASSQPEAIAMTPSKSSSRFIDIEEILDSEDEALEALSPTPPRKRNFQDLTPLPLFSLDPSPVKAPLKPSTNTLAHTPVFRIDTSNLQWVHIKTEIFNQITTHIRAIPPTNNPKQPSWHEKILMYDPIVLEDFTAYLNAQTNIRTYRRATQKQIKAWNQMLKGDGQSILSVDESGDEVLAIEKELEAYMAQGWCESMSVCCIWGEGRGKGGARKGLY
ncbi:uncharacterized protein K460DRAFT_355904 [Cucurbitaria berberidis CBS 394.84]|uniref:Structure-specific endonuclease subunit SLX4 n=1 Tax=Cucurbitaria berberidis CBS 394.84 TaxID=1168544 RepID=A0A9P4GHF1_9PLEO|nr:uncharacterized protein K460DRAFT_355904 [Cucurbitaria berberidis CBS 394.84]KAF1846193.1 hypothetical protein K460DRAFT_355904 [Cucurbitaria berberidis CBS 394.84]